MNRLLTLGATLVFTVSAVATEKPQVEAVGAAEVRTTGESDAGSSTRPDPGLTVVLRVNGLDQPARFGRVVVTEAKDDAGTDLIKDDSSKRGDDEKITELPNVTRPAGGSVVEDVPKAFYARVHLGLSARQARRIASLKGEIHIAVGGGEKPSVVTVPGVKALRGKTVEHPDLAGAGVTVQVAQQGPQDELQLAILVSGQVPRDSNVTVVGADGKGISRGGSSGIGKNNIQCSVDLQRPLRDTDALRIKLPLGQKSVTVPFELKDVALP